MVTPSSSVSASINHYVPPPPFNPSVMNANYRDQKESLSDELINDVLEDFEFDIDPNLTEEEQTEAEFAALSLKFNSVFEAQRVAREALAAQAWLTADPELAEFELFLESERAKVEKTEDEAQPENDSEQFLEERLLNRYEALCSRSYSSLEFELQEINSNTAHVNTPGAFYVPRKPSVPSPDVLSMSDITFPTRNVDDLSNNLSRMGLTSAPVELAGALLVESRSAFTGPSSNSLSSSSSSSSVSSKDSPSVSKRAERVRRREEDDEKNAQDENMCSSAAFGGPISSSSAASSSSSSSGKRKKVELKTASLARQEFQLRALSSSSSSITAPLTGYGKKRHIDVKVGQEMDDREKSEPSVKKANIKLFGMNDMIKA